MKWLWIPVWFLFSRIGENARSNFSSNAMWEIYTDGSKVRPLLPQWRVLPSENGEMTWTADGKHFLYVSKGQIWTLQEKGALFHREINPVQLTSSPLVLSNPTPSRDGKKLFAVGYDQRGELMRYDVKSRQFIPFLGGISAEFASFSPTANGSHMFSTRKKRCGAARLTVRSVCN